LSLEYQKSSIENVLTALLVLAGTAGDTITKPTARRDSTASNPRNGNSTILLCLRLKQNHSLEERRQYNIAISQPHTDAGIRACDATAKAQHNTGIDDGLSEIQLVS
jgi:hypothetical protein